MSTRPSTRADVSPSAFAYRPALDGVRALAVTAVLLFHAGVSWLPGGFLGVDAFFVLSGYLITSLLLAEQAQHSRIRLGAFWLRRARRLLPALLLVVLFTGYVFRRLLSATELALLRVDALAALGYVANWRMIYRGNGYFTQTSVPSPLQHTWSLGIEEQFYLGWPLIVVALLAIGLRRIRTTLAALCLAGAAASAVAAAVRYQPTDINRAYFGTDTRAQALLVGCALGALLASSGKPESEKKSWLVEGVAVLGIAGVGTVAWLWTHARGGDAWLYRGELTLGALAVAAVIAHTVVSPHELLGRVLAARPLVWLGKISYGVYLWHWPLFNLLDAQRTGLVGPQLLAARLVATVAVAAFSYVLIEEPVRTGRSPLRRSDSGRRLQIRPVTAGIGASVAVGITGVLVVVAATPRTSGVIRPVGAILTPAPSAPTLTGNSPMLRPDRRPGAEPRLTFFGDSVSASLASQIRAHPGLKISTRAIEGCGIARLPDIIQLGENTTNFPTCTRWDALWRRGVDADDPDVAVILLDRWELMDRKLGKTYQHVGDPEYDNYLNHELELAVSIAGARGARVVLLTAPYTRRAERPDGGLYDEDLPERVNAWNGLLKRTAARHPRQVGIVDLNARVCPNGTFTAAVDHIHIRSDGLHFTPEGVRLWIAPWLLPQLTAIAVGR
jgi:peptidoglycan/LPS O-acetylase OafA/YrhL